MDQLGCTGRQPSTKHVSFDHAVPHHLLLCLIAESTDLFGSFVLSAVAYTTAFAELLLSPEGSHLASNVGGELMKELNQFGLPGLQEASLTSVTNR